MYKLLAESSLLKLETKVSEFVLNGWIPCGGPFEVNLCWWQAVYIIHNPMDDRL